ncbi:MAG: hypothetical protein V3T33_00050 [Myxococcota bacterium]
MTEHDSTRSDFETDRESSEEPGGESGQGSERPGVQGRRTAHERERGDGFRRKGRVLHTRVSEELSEDIRRLARDLRVPASNLVRNVLEEVFSVVESVSEDVGELLEEVLEEADGARDRIRRRMAEHRWRRRRRHSHRRDSVPDEEELERELRQDERAEAGAGTDLDADDPMNEVLGWQPLVLNRDLRCARCGRELARGEQAFLGLTERGPSRLTLCQTCTETS